MCNATKQVCAYCGVAGLFSYEKRYEVVKKFSVLLCMTLASCHVMSNTTGGADGDSMNDEADVDGVRALAAISFSSDVSRGMAPTNFAIGDGSIDFAGGVASLDNLVLTVASP